MEHFARLDVSVKDTSVCVVNDDEPQVTPVEGH
jgi:hypothetical protein